MLELRRQDPARCLEQSLVLHVQQVARGAGQEGGQGACQTVVLVMEEQVQGSQTRDLVHSRVACHPSQGLINSVLALPSVLAGVEGFDLDLCECVGWRDSYVCQ